jgi:uncharacterized protein (DUF433 family)
MKTTATGYAHIELRDGMPYVTGTRIRVLDLVLQQRDWGMNAEQIAYQHPELTRAQVHSALAYYYDHQDQFECLIATEEHFWEEVRSGTRESPITVKLRALGLIR